MITTFYIPTRIISGAGAFSLLGAEAGTLGRHALLVTGKNSMRRSGLLDRAVADLEGHGIQVTVFDRVEPNPRSTTVDAGAAIIREKNLDLVVALGGGSAMDAAKGMVMAAHWRQAHLALCCNGGKGERDRPEADYCSYGGCQRVRSQ